MLYLFLNKPVRAFNFLVIIDGDNSKFLSSFFNSSHKLVAVPRKVSTKKSSIKTQRASSSSSLLSSFPRKVHLQLSFSKLRLKQKPSVSRLAMVNLPLEPVRFSFSAYNTLVFYVYPKHHLLHQLNQCYLIGY